ncbi:MAG: hypothetical protein N4A35_03140 [Flavobacteriales bacterium]|jgi:hypothetical protein|nr:hypothetical protein [Flavobacteriales bacterium]
MNFPQYRKYKNIATYFVIHSAKHFEEIKVIGSKYAVSEVEASQFPEQLLIQDMLENREARWETVSASDFATIINEIKTTKIKIG